MTLLPLMLLSTLGRSPVAAAERTDPSPVLGVPERTGPPGCGVHFEVRDGRTGWTRFRNGEPLTTEEEWTRVFGLPGTYVDPELLLIMPPHDEHAFGPPVCGSDLREQLPEYHIANRWFLLPLNWRIVDRDGVVLTEFQGPYARDARPLATVLSAVDDYDRGQADPACLAHPGRACWTAFELWVYLEEWADRHCVRTADAATAPDL